MARFLVSSRISDRISETREGYLLCAGVPIARTGSLDYLPEEVGIAPAAGSETVTVYRMAEDLFAPAAMASFEGKPVTIDHPDEDVTPANWRELAKGHAQNLRRGEGAEADLLLADLLITDADAIAAIRDDGVREISCGYDAEYAAVATGVGRQTRIIGNHIALVDAGRCGPRCAIRDKDTVNMASAIKRGLLGAIFGTPAIKKTFDSDPKLKKVLDEAVAEEIDPGKDPIKASADEDPAKTADEDPAKTDDEDPQAEILLLLRSIMQKLDAGAAPAADEDPETPATDEDPVTEETTGDEDPDPQPATQDARRRVADSGLIAAAAMIAPGLAARVGDSAVLIKRTALRSAKDAAVRRTIDAVLGGKSIAAADRATLDAAFAAAAEVSRARTNRATADALTAPGGRGKSAVETPADLNAQFAKYRDSLGAK